MGGEVTCMVQIERPNDQYFSALGRMVFSGAGLESSIRDVAKVAHKVSGHPKRLGKNIADRLTFLERQLTDKTMLRHVRDAKDLLDERNHWVHSTSVVVVQERDGRAMAKRVLSATRDDETEFDIPDHGVLLGLRNRLDNCAIELIQDAAHVGSVGNPPVRKAAPSQPRAGGHSDSG